jgi:pimeloyl-ACP methyl ester carboxylesterase
METPLQFSSDGEVLFGTLCQVGDGRRMVVLIHGWGGPRMGPQTLLVRMARALAAAGISSFRFDCRGRGDSTGEPSATTVDDMIADTVAAMDFLSREQGAPQFRLWGLCSGGNVAVGAVSLRPEVVDRIVACSLLPFMEQKHASSRGQHLAKTLRQYAKKALRPDTWRRLLRGEINVKESSRVLVANPEGDAAEQERKRSRRDILGDFARYRGDLCLVYGRRDPDYPSAHAAYATYCRERNIPLQVHIVEGSNHNFYSVAWSEEVVTRTSAWLGEGW